jgi:hypothetical protein
VLGLILIGAAILVIGLKTRPRGAVIGLGFGVAGVYLLTFLRMASPEERTHLFEYCIVALLIYEALVPALLAILITALFGWVDEGIQALLTNHVFDIRDVGYNALAAVMAIAAGLYLLYGRRRFG